jgi:uncharacterized tellurite resistance protein B-like protein
MFNLFKNNKEDQKSSDQSYSKIAALLIHAAKIDGSYTKDEEKIIKKTLVELGAKLSNIDLIIANAINFEENSNQILDFTREIKNAAESDKIKIIESLWKIIYSNNIGDMYETNLMRRLAGLLYIDAKIMGDIKEKIKKELKK